MPSALGHIIHLKTKAVSVLKEKKTSRSIICGRDSPKCLHAYILPFWLTSTVCDVLLESGKTVVEYVIFAIIWMLLPLLLQPT